MHVALKCQWTFMIALAIRRSSHGTRQASLTEWNPQTMSHRMVFNIKIRIEAIQQVGSKTFMKKSFLISQKTLAELNPPCEFHRKAPTINEHRMTPVDCVSSNGTWKQFVNRSNSTHVNFVPYSINLKNEESLSLTSLHND